MTPMLRRLIGFALVLTLPALAAVPGAAVPQDVFAGVDRVVAIGDVHGGYDEFVALLRAAGLVDARQRWSGGRAHLVQTGDLIDRGPDSRRVNDLVMRLEAEALKAGGRVHALLGNHEVMNVTGDLRYVSAAEFAAFATKSSASVRNRAYPALADPAKKDDPAYRQQWQLDHPPGWVEHRQAYSLAGRYGRWISGRNTVVKINDHLFLHGGIGPAIAGLSIREINDRVRAEMRLNPVPTDGLAVGRGGPLWYRGLAREPEDELLPRVDALLAKHGVAHIVVGHTTTPGAIVPRLGGKIILIDVGLSAYYGTRPACLVVESGTAFALHRDRRLPLPLGPGADVMEYLRAAAALDPQPSPLEPLLRAGGRLPLPVETPEKR